jgi:hypothetical protein
MATLTMSKNRAGAYALALLIAGCSSSSSPSSQNGDSGAVADTGAVSQSEGSTTGDGGNVCAAIVADVQALVVPAIASLQNTVDGCIPLLAGDGGQLDMQVLYGADADKSLYNQENGGSTHSIAGIGDEAYWVEAVPGASIPELLAHKGDETCIVSPPEPPDTTCKTTPSTESPLIYTVADSDALASVQLMGTVCDDVFAIAQ